MKILLVDDDQELTNLLKMELEDFGHNIDISYDGISGLDFALKNAYDMIILDLMLPGADGHTICRTIRRHNIPTPVLMISSLDSASEKATGHKAGADDYLVKPFQFEVLYNKIIMLDNKHRQES
jgi:DNA-binding response OmpR family regulator